MEAWDVLEGSAVQALKAGARDAVIDDMVDADFDLSTADDTADGERIIGLSADALDLDVEPVMPRRGVGDLQSRPGILSG